ncbi:MAG: hypothetical protein ACI9WU_001855, partial [Myxococcota bacterium]
GEIPATGEVLTCRYPVPSKTGIRWVRLVGVIVRSETGRKPGFGVETISVDNLGIPRLFEEHVDALSRAGKRGGVRMRIRENVLPFPRR